MAEPHAPPLFQAQGLVKRYRLGGVTLEALRGLDLTIQRGELVALAGPSGNGKTTLLNLLGTLDLPDAGTVLFEGTDLARLGESQRTLLRRRRLGFVFQTFNLVPVLSAEENVDYPLWIDGVARPERRHRVAEALEAVGLGRRARHRPDQLSGGERQRVALARALVHRPAAVLADEPTGNLDTRTGQEIVDLLAQLNESQGTTVLVATHDPAVLERAPRRILLRDGAIAADGGTGSTAWLAAPCDRPDRARGAAS